MGRNASQTWVCRTRQTPIDEMLGVIPLWQPMSYQDTRDTIAGALIRLDEYCLTLDLDGGLSSLVAFRRLAITHLEQALQDGELQPWPLRVS